ncbi:MAG: type II 3-dehydroquinate dehydratase [Ignavibacteriales bacterium]|nr:type II 3-dehydroquinate dehydratase [Ignavibacteriales bacterium]
MRILVVNGPNLNLLGTREPELYGATTLWDIEKKLKEVFPKIAFEFYQSNSEGAIIDTLHKAVGGAFDAVIINAGAYSHTSYAIRDALSMLKIPAVEVHLTNIHAREEFRHTSVTAPVCKGIIAGLGAKGYELAVRFLVEQ